MHVPSYEAPLSDFPEYVIYKNVMVYVPPVILLLGTFGNIMTFIILTRKSMRKQSTYIYLAVLSITDIFVLYVGLLRIWIKQLSGYDIKDRYEWSCRLIVVLGYTVSDYSVWLIIAVTVERWIAVCKPLKAPSLCNRQKAFKIILAILAVLIIINLHFSWTVSIMIYPYKDEFIQICEKAPGFKVLVEEVWPWVDACIYSFLPLGIIMTLNSLIIHQVILSRNARRDLSGPQTSGCTTTSGEMRPDRNRRHQENSYKVTIMLLTISFTFIVTTLPMNSMLIANAFLGPTNDLHGIARRKMIQAFTELLMYLNHSMNFFLYCATGEKFRHQLLRLFCSKKPQMNLYSQTWQTDKQIALHSVSGANGMSKSPIPQHGRRGRSPDTEYTCLHGDKL